MFDAATFLMVLTGWLQRREREVIAYLVEENRVLRGQLGGRRRVGLKPTGTVVCGARPRYAAALPGRNYWLARRVDRNGIAGTRIYMPPVRF